MSRVPLAGVGDQPEEIRQFMTRHGELNVFRLIANAPEVFIGWAQMVDEMLGSPTLGARMRELIILRVAHLQQSAYELNQHLGLGRAAGLDDRQIDVLVGDGDAGVAGFSPTELAVLDVVNELCLTHRVRPQSFARAQSALGDEALTEVLMVISCYYGLALVVNAVELDIDETAQLRV
ncbi:carboxymuconolactone decarboxylase family protein [Mycobacterium sp. UM_CSW]|uniref:carboxymuconolactone decarboxylase family protein n=1 Tax=Mycobacterium sp. UM_CSW TaxID=1370119 RepID=UPI00040A5022|nr:carboxymuconolactone decarboxylase family protein [Mycobacterium sp. UM_CSW]